MARIGLRMMPPFPSSPLKFRKAGFPHYGFKAGISDGACPSTASSSRRAVCVRPSWTSLPVIALSSFRVEGRGALIHPRSSGVAAFPQGSSLRSELFCLGPSSLTRPHAPHSPAHPAFADTAYTRCPRCASELQCLGDQRVDPCFHWPFGIDMSPSETPGFSSTACTQFFVDDAGLRPLGKVSAPPTPFTLRFP